MSGVSYPSLSRFRHDPVPKVRLDFTDIFQNWGSVISQASCAMPWYWHCCHSTRKWMHIWNPDCMLFIATFCFRMFDDWQRNWQKVACNQCTWQMSMKKVSQIKYHQCRIITSVTYLRVSNKLNVTSGYTSDCSDPVIVLNHDVYFCIVASDVSQCPRSDHGSRPLADDGSQRVVWRIHAATDWHTELSG